jgi:hypothetical protein
MPKKKSIFEGARDLVEQGIKSVKNITAFFRSTSRDRRTIKSTQRAMREATQGRTNKEIGEQLGVSYQRVTAIKKAVEEGTAYSPELRDLFQEEAQRYNEEPRELEGGVYLFPNREKLERSVNNLDTIKTFPELDDALKYWGKIIQSDDYIAIVKEKDDFYSVVGLGRRSQRPKGPKHEISDRRAKNRLDQILTKYPRRK